MKLSINDRVRFTCVHVSSEATVEAVDVENQMIVVRDDAGERWHLSPKAIDSVLVETKFDGELDSKTKQDGPSSHSIWRGAIGDIANAIATVMDTNGVAFLIDSLLSIESDERIESDDVAYAGSLLFDLLTDLRPQAIPVAQENDYRIGEHVVRDELFETTGEIIAKTFDSSTLKDIVRGLASVVEDEEVADEVQADNEQIDAATSLLDSILKHSPASATN